MKYELPANTPRSRRWRYTPVGQALRGNLSGVLDHETILKNTGLSADAIAYALAILQRIKLWTSEKITARDELIDELLAREQQGQHIDTIKQEMGTPRAVRKNIYKAMLKRRPRWWQVTRKIQLGIGCALLGLVALHLLTGVWFASMDRAKPTVDYLAKINAKAAAIPEADRAWPIYREAILESGFRKSDVDKLASRYNDWATLDSQKKADATAVVEEFSVLIGKVRQGAALPGLGLVIPRGAKFTGDDELVMKQLESMSGYGQDLAGIYADVLLLSDANSPAHMHVVRALVTLICDDMFVAADKKQMNVVLADFRSLMGLASQLREHPIYMCQLSARSTYARGLSVISHIMETKADQFTDAQLVELRKLLAMYDTLPVLDAEASRYVLLDTLQRNYAPNGRIAGDGMLKKMMNGTMSSNRNALSAFLIDVMSLPLMNLFLPSRDELKQRLTQLQDDTVSFRRLPLWEKLRTTSPYDQYEAKQKAARFVRIQSMFSLEWFLVTNEMNVVSHSLLPVRDATDVAVALEQFRRAQGAYPESLAALVPEYLNALPVDHSTGLPLLYKLVDGKPLLYGRGQDNDDDGGVIVKSTGIEANPSKVPVQGDWILYPLPVDD